MPRGRWLRKTRVVLDVLAPTHPLEFKPMVNNFELVDTCFEPGKLLLQLLARHGRSRFCARRGRGIGICGIEDLRMASNGTLGRLRLRRMRPRVRIGLLEGGIDGAVVGRMRMRMSVSWTMMRTRSRRKGWAGRWRTIVAHRRMICRRMGRPGHIRGRRGRIWRGIRLIFERLRGTPIHRELIRKRAVHRH